MIIRVLVTAAAFTTMAFGAMAQEGAPAPAAAAAVEPAAPAEAAAPAPAAAPAADPAPVRERRICRRQEQTGSRLGGRTICHTRLEWEAQGEAGRKFLREMQNAPTMQCGQSAVGCGG